jgi:aromatic-L-amino-acid/L-tryptophan decarboxylase
MRGDLTVYTSSQAHSSVEKGAMAAGFGQDNVRKIPVDADFRMVPPALEAALDADVRAGKRPCCVVPSLGTTSTSSIDPVARTIEIAHRHGAWVHVDGAYGGSAALLPEYKWMTEESAGADSFVINPHKWMFTPIDCSVFYTSRPDVLRNALALTPEYLRTAQDDVAVNLMEYGVPLGRRFRSLKLWFVMRYFGLERMRAIIGNHILWAREFASWIKEDERFELCAPVPLSLVCFRLRGEDDAPSRELMDRVNAEGTAFLSHTVLNGRFVLRMALGNVRTTREDVELLWQRLQAEARLLF